MNPLKALPYRRGTRIPRLLGGTNYLDNYFAMYTRLTAQTRS